MNNTIHAWLSWLLLVLTPAAALAIDPEDPNYFKARGTIKSIVLVEHYTYFEVERGNSIEWIGTSSDERFSFKVGECLDYVMFKYANAYKMPPEIRDRSGLYWFWKDVGHCEAERIYKKTTGRQFYFSDRPIQ